jgi:trehalose-6-phosphatase
LQEKCPYAFDCLNEIKTIMQGKKIALFLDYDGTLSRIVDNYDEAFMSDDVSIMNMLVADVFSMYLYEK